MFTCSTGYQIEGEAFRPSTGAGYVAPVKGDYARAKRNGCDVYTLLFETRGHVARRGQASAGRGGGGGPRQPTAGYESLL